MPFDDALCCPVQEHTPGPGLAVAKFKRITADFRPLEFLDLAAPASGQEQETDDIGLHPAGRPFGDTPVKFRVESADFVLRQEAGEAGPRVALDAAGGIGRDVTVDNGPVHDLVKHLQGKVRATRSGGAVAVESPGDVKPCDPVERHGAEFRQELGSEGRDGTLAGRWLEPVQAGCLPLAFDKLAEPWNRGRVGG